MIQIHQIIRQALNSGYLSLEAEDQLRYFFSTTRDLEDIDALIKLHKAVIAGRVEREAFRLT